MEVVAYFVDCFFFRLYEGSGGVEGIFLKEETDFVAGCEEVVVTHMLSVWAFAGRKFGHWMIG